MRREDSTKNLSRDMARKIAFYLGNRNNFFAFSSVNRKLRDFFLSERENFIKMPKIHVKKKQASSFLHTFDGKLYACGNLFSSQNPPQTALSQWTLIGPPDKKILEFSFSEKGFHLFVQCDDAWHHLGNSLSDWRPIIGPHGRSIIKFISNETHIFVFCKDEVWYESEFNSVAKLNWKRLGRPWKKTFELLVLEKRQFLRDEEGWYGRGENKNGELGFGHSSEWENWTKLGPTDKKVLQVKANDLNTVIYCSDGLWYGCGQNNSGQLGPRVVENEVQCNWIPLGPKDKLIFSIFLGGNKTFAYCADGLYACGDSRDGFGLDVYRENHDWVYVGFANQEIMEIIIRENATFVRSSKGWYACGSNEGVLGYGDERSHDKWKKIHCEGHKILNIAPSDEYTFAACDDAWYFAGNAWLGQNGLGDNIGKRSRWVKVLAHGETVESLQARLAQEKIEREKEPPSVKFRRTLQKLYDLKIVKWLEKSAYEFHQTELRICYHPIYPESSIYFLISSLGMGMIDGFLEDEFNGRIKEILETSSFDFVHEPSDIQLLGFRQYYSIGWYHECPEPSMSAIISLENYEGLCWFLRDYEAILDEQELIASEASAPKMEK